MIRVVVGNHFKEWYRITEENAEGEVDSDRELKQKCKGKNAFSPDAESSLLWGGDLVEHKKNHHPNVPSYCAVLLQQLLSCTQLQGRGMDLSVASFHAHSFGYKSLWQISNRFAQHLKYLRGAVM